MWWSRRDYFGLPALHPVGRHFVTFELAILPMRRTRTQVLNPSVL